MDKRKNVKLWLVRMNFIETSPVNSYQVETRKESREKAGFLPNSPPHAFFYEEGETQAPHASRLLYLYLAVEENSTAMHKTQNAN